MSTPMYPVLQSGNNTYYAPSAPPAGYVDSFAGYEGASFDDKAGQVSPPPYQMVYPEVFPMRPPIQSEALTEAEARQAFIEFAQEECCYGKSAAENCTITSIDNTSAYHYCLETFAESRKTNWKFQPYKGEAIPPFAAPPPEPWAIPATHFTYFEESKVQIPIPETTIVKECHNCEGRGQCRCGTCSGWGKINCSSCNGRGHCDPKESQEGPQNCSSCKGYGKKTCPKCEGKDRLPCEICQSKQKLRYYIELEVVWSTFKDHHVVETCSLPKYLIHGAKGTVIFQEELPQVAPISNFPDQEVNKGSADVHTKQIANVVQTHRIIRQRHTLSVVPISQVNYTWKGDQRYFFVYGKEKRAYDPDYPQKCCCGLCTIL